MTVLEWDAPGEKIYQTGVDRGVLYLTDGTYTAWNGLTGLDDGNNSELKSYYLDGIKYLEIVTPGEFVGKLKAFTYPDEFERVIGVIESESPGLYFHEQPTNKFHLTYRTKIGSDTDPDSGYKLNLLYNLSAVPDSAGFATLQETLEPVEFSWSLSGTPPLISGHRPTCHISIDSTKTEAALLAAIERVLYGTPSVEPRMPSISEVETWFLNEGKLVLTDNGDGTWTADDVGEHYITMIDSSTFEIHDAVSEYLDPYTYTITDTSVSTPGVVQPFAQLYLKSPNNSNWVITVTNDGHLDLAAYGSTPPVVEHQFTLGAADGGIWAFSVTNDGTLDVESATPGGPHLTDIQMKAPDNGVWVITVTNDGTLNVAAL